MQIHNAAITGSFTYNGSDISNVSSSNAYSASFSTRVTNTESTGSSLTTASGSFSTRTTNLESTGSSLITASGSFSTRVTNTESTGSSLTTASGSFSIRISSIEGNYATTGSNIFMGAQTVCANITSTGTIVAQTINVQQVTSSIVYSSGSNIFGNAIGNTQVMTGSVSITGSLNTIGSSCVNGSLSVLNGNQFRVYNTGNGDYGNLTFATATGFTSDKQIQANEKLFIQRASNGADTLLQFKNQAGADRAYIKFGGTNEELAFYAGAGTTQNFIINAAGCVGINTSCPKDLLEIYGSTNNGINICASDQPRLGFFVGGTSVDNKIWDFIPQSNNTFIARVVNDAKNSAATWISVTRSGTSITSICFPQPNPIVISGCVGIGIVPNGPGLRLASCTVLRVEGACSGDAAPDNFGISIGGHGSFRVDCSGVGSGRFIINSCGCVGINQPSPIFKLQVSSGGAKTSGTQDPSLFIGTNEVSNPWGLRVKPVGAASINNRYVEFQTTEVNVADGGNVVFQNGGGRVGIGCASPSYVLDVRDGTTGSAGGRGMRLSVCSNSAGPQFRLEYQCSGDSRNWLIGTNQEVAGDFIIRSSTVAGCDPGGSCSVARLSILKEGNIGIRNISPSSLLHVGNGNVGTSCSLVSAIINAKGGWLVNEYEQMQIGISALRSTYNDSNYWSLSFLTTTNSTAGLTERFTITGDGRSYFQCQLRVGTASVATNFFIDASTAGCIVSGTPGTAHGTCISGMRLYNLCSATDNSLVGLWFSTGPHWAGLASGRCVANSGWGTDIRFYTHEDATNNLDQSTERVRINAGGTVTFFGYGAGTLSTNSSGVISASDGRLKTKTRVVENGLCTIMQLKPTYYRWNECTAFHTEYEELGFIAQEVSCIIPEASPEPEQEDKLKNYNDRAIIAMLTKAIQEQQCKINLLESCLGLT